MRHVTINVGQRAKNFTLVPLNHKKNSLENGFNPTDLYKTETMKEVLPKNFPRNLSSITKKKLNLQSDYREITRNESIRRLSAYSTRVEPGIHIKKQKTLEPATP